LNVTDDECALFLSEYSRRKNLHNVGITCHASDYPETFLDAFVIIETEINKKQNEELERKRKKKGR